MLEFSSTSFTHCLKCLLRPAVRFSLRRSIGVQGIIEVVKMLCIELAAEEMEQRGEKVNVSRLSVSTGLHRRDVFRLFKIGETRPEQPNLAARVIGQWEQDARFTTKSKKPRVLSVDGDRSEFRDLVRSVSSDVHPGTVLFELERLGAVVRASGGLKLEKRVYTPVNDPEAAFSLVSLDYEDLLGAVEENVFNPPDVANLHARTEYDNIRASTVPMLKNWLLKEGTELHTRARALLAKYDQDITPEGDREPSVRVVLGAFSRVVSNQPLSE